MKKGIWMKEYLWAVLVLLFVHTGLYLLLPVITIYGRMLSGSDALAGMMASVFALSGLFARFLSAYLLERMPVKKVLQLFAAGLAIGFANGSLAPVINTKMVNSLPDSAGGLANVAFFAAGDAGFIIGPAFWGIIAGILGYQKVFLASAAVGVPALCMQMFEQNKKEA